MSPIRKKPGRLIEDPNFLCATNDGFSSIVVPQSYEEEMSFLKENETWCLVKLPNGRKTVKNK